MGFHKVPCDVEDFPIGSRVKLPTGRTGVVMAHKGYESREDPFMRVMIKLDGSDRQGMVQLQPQFLKPWVEGRDSIQTWVGDYFQVGDGVRLPTGRTGVVLSIRHGRKSQSVIFLLIGIDSDDGQQEEAELPAHLVEKLPASWVPPKRIARQPGGGSRLRSEPDPYEAFPALPLHTEAPLPVKKINIDQSAPDSLRSPEAQILQAIRDLGNDPAAFPPSPTARKAKAKRLVKARTQLRSRQFDQVWRRLCVDGRIVERRVTCPSAFARGFAQGLAGGGRVQPAAKVNGYGYQES